MAKKNQKMDKSQKRLLAIIVIASIALVAVLGVTWYYDSSKSGGHAMEVNVRVFGPGWRYIADGVGIDDSSAMSAIRQAGTDNGFSVTTNTSYVMAINGTYKNWPYGWRYGVNGVASSASLAQISMKDGDTLTFWYTDNNTSVLPTGTITVKVFGNGWNSTTIIGVENVSALKALEIAGDYSHFAVATKHYAGMGDLVTAINGTASTTTEYWLFGVNGVSSSAGADATYVHPGDKVTFWFTSDYSSQPPGR